MLMLEEWRRKEGMLEEEWRRGEGKVKEVWRRGEWKVNIEADTASFSRLRSIHF